MGFSFQKELVAFPDGPLSPLLMEAERLRLIRWEKTALTPGHYDSVNAWVFC